MGACSIDFFIKGHASIKDIEKKFIEIKLENKHDNGHCEGYSGDFQTVGKVNFSYLFDGSGNLEKDFEFCLDKAEKWENVVAIYTKDERGKDITLIAGWGAC